MSTRLGSVTRNPIVAVLVVAGVVAYLFVFHFLLGMTWMLYVLVLAVIVLLLVRKVSAIRRQKAGLAKH